MRTPPLVVLRLTLAPPPFNVPLSRRLGPMSFPSSSLAISRPLVRTPPFTAPEVFYLSAIDARTDLFSLGATLYSALVGRPAYPARELSGLPKVWAQPVVPPSAIVPEIPAELDALVMSLLSLRPELRPRTAFEVMHKLSAIAGFSRPEPASVSMAYLSTPTMVGRDDVLAGRPSPEQKTMAERRIAALQR